MTPEHTDMTGAARLREALERTTSALARMPDAGLAEGDPRYRWWYDEAAPALAEAREALAAVPEAPGEECLHWHIERSGTAHEPAAAAVCVQCGTRFVCEPVAAGCARGPGDTP